MKTFTSRYSAILSLALFTVAIGQEIWTPGISQTTNNLNGIAYGDSTIGTVTYNKGSFITVGDSSTILISNNGFDWRNLTKSTNKTHTYHCVAWYHTIAIPSSWPTQAFFTIASDSLVIFTLRMNNDTSSSTAFNLLHNQIAQSGYFSSITEAGNDLNIIAIRYDSFYGIVVEYDTSSYGSPLSGWRVGLRIAPILYNCNAIIKRDYSDYFIVGNNGFIGTNISKGVAIQKSINITNYNLNGIATGKGLFVTVGNNGTIYTTRDSNTWVSCVSGTIQNLNAITYGNNVFVAVGSNGTIVASSDGYHWSNFKISNCSNIFKSVIYQNGLYIAVGTEGAIYTSPISNLHAPSLLSPVNNATTNMDSINLCWNGVVAAFTYQLQVSTDTTFKNLVFNDSAIVSTSQEINNLQTTNKYSWRVRAINSSGFSAWSTFWGFSYILAAPGAPILSYPSKGALNISLGPTLLWSVTSGAASYHLQVSTTSNFGTNIVDDSTITTISKTIGSLIPSTFYYCRVNAKNAGGTSAWSSLSYFTTVPPPPSAPTIRSPVNHFAGVAVNPNLSWNSVTGATSYSIQVSTDSQFTTLITNQNGLTETSINLSSLNYLTSYYWRVNATNAGGTSNWSATATFKTVAITNVISSKYALMAFESKSTGYILHYALPTPCIVNLEYYDIKGRLVAVLVNKRQISGLYTLQLPIMMWAKGVYIQFFKAGTFEKKEIFEVVR